jgi:hypothetical protein
MPIDETPAQKKARRVAFQLILDAAQIEEIGHQQLV